MADTIYVLLYGFHTLPNMLKRLGICIHNKATCPSKRFFQHIRECMEAILLSEDTRLSGRDLKSTMLERCHWRDTIFRDLRAMH